MKLTYANKVAINENAEIPNINKVTDSDMNEIKAVVNNNDDELITINTKLTNATTYSTTETVVGTWTDNKPIYRKVIRNNVIGTAVNHGILNIDEITDIKLIVLQQSGLYSPQNSDSIYMGDTDYIVYLKTTNVLNYKIIVEYTKKQQIN